MPADEFPAGARWVQSVMEGEAAVEASAGPAEWYTLGWLDALDAAAAALAGLPGLSPAEVLAVMRSTGTEDQ